ncbi:MAG: phosphonopyruvate decarboxylase [Paludibacteraceae bacterium]|nr:phosphonopyruvate decarboxylase [Paludibacteraceae bacterium]
MIQPKDFIERLRAGGVDFFAGVPDSLLKNLCAFITDNVSRENNIIAANEGGAVALAAGYHLATGKTGCVYMQNSGEGNAVNPLLSLMDADVYRMPLLMIIGWRGEPGVHDEPQHVKQGKVTLSLLETMGVSYAVLDENWEQQVSEALKTIHETNGVFALIIRKGTFENYVLQNQTISSLPMSREEAIKMVADKLREDDIVVSTTGMISRELFEYRVAKQQGHSHDFLTVGSMGHASQIALGIALQKPERRVFVFDGDRALLMHMGGMAIIGDYCPKNLVHIVFNNGAHDSVGGQPTVGQKIDIEAIAKAVGYADAVSVDSHEALMRAMNHLNNAAIEGTILINVNVHKGNRKDLGRPTTTPIQNKEAFMANLSD